MKKNQMIRTATLALALSALLFAGCAPTQTPVETPTETPAETPTETPEAPQGGAPASESPAAMRAIFNMNGMRYAMSDEPPIEAVLGEELGTIEVNMMDDPDTYAMQDFAGTGYVGGTIHAIEGVDSAYRVAVAIDGEVIVFDRVAHVDGTPTDLTTYFEASKIMDNIVEVNIFDHMGSKLLRPLSDEEGDMLLSAVKESEPAVLENADYEAIAAAQTAGESFFVRAALEDGSTFTFYITPSLSIASVLDDRFVMDEDFTALATTLTDGLTQGELPQMGEAPAGQAPMGSPMGASMEIDGNFDGIIESVEGDVAMVSVTRASDAFPIGETIAVSMEANQEVTVGEEVTVFYINVRESYPMKTDAVLIESVNSNEDMADIETHELMPAA